MDWLCLWLRGLFRRLLGFGVGLFGYGILLLYFWFDAKFYVQATVLSVLYLLNVAFIQVKLRRDQKMAPLLERGDAREESDSDAVVIQQEPPKL